MGTILEIRSVRKAFEGLEVLHGVDLSIQAGERVALMGPSGSGKSTLLNCLCGIEGVDSGSIRIGDTAIETCGAKAMDRVRKEMIGYVFQTFHLLPTLSAFENIELPGQLLGMDRTTRLARVRELLAAVGLSERADHRPDQLSGGERQRIALARAVMHRPSIILADEPTGSLDSVSGERVLNLMEQLSEESGVALLLVTHDPASTRICDRVVRMRDGRIEGSEEV